LAAIAAIVALLVVACETIPPIQPVDLSQPGWHVRQGQGVWKPSKEQPELAGDILVATADNGDFFVQFTKNPFTMAMARKQGSRWQIEVGEGQRRWSGAGSPPRGFAWCELPRAAAGTPVESGWVFRSVDAENWVLECRSTGERLEGYFQP
jgi:hypothetical protein